MKEPPLFATMLAFVVVLTGWIAYELNLSIRVRNAYRPSPLSRPHVTVRRTRRVYDQDRTP